MVLIASIIAMPLAWWAMQNWLQNYSYKVSLGWWIFPAAGVSVLAIAMVTVGYQTLRSALANPVRSLRTEYLKFWRNLKTEKTQFCKSIHQRRYVHALNDLVFPQHLNCLFN